MAHELIPMEVYARYLDGLVQRAYQKHPLEAICTLLRVDGLQNPEWDPFAESEAAMRDFELLRTTQIEGLSSRAGIRIGLLMYCQLVEMGWAHHMLANLFRVLRGKRYTIVPFHHLVRRKKNAFHWTPPSSASKLRDISREAGKQGDRELQVLLSSFFNDGLRNAFSHSDYIITDKAIRWTEGGGGALSIEQLGIVITNAFSFFSVFIGLQKRWLSIFTKVDRFYPQRNFEVLELLVDESGLYRFAIHFSNGTRAEFSRTANGVNCMNFLFNADGTLAPMIGDVRKLVPVHMINGVPLAPTGL